MTGSRADRAPPAPFRHRVAAAAFLVVTAVPALALTAVPALVLTAVPALVLTAVPALVLTAVPALVLTAVPAAGQEAVVGPPVRLVPAPAAPQAPTVATAGPAGPPGMPDTPPPRPGTILAVPLGRPDSDGAGTLGPLQGGIPGDLWGSTPRATVLGLLATLPTEAPSPSQTALARRLLLTDATAPAVTPDEPPPPRRLAALRVQMVAALGDARSARALAALLPAALEDEAAARALAEAELAAGTLDCPAAQALAARFTTPWWRALTVFCEARDGDRARARAGIAGVSGPEWSDGAFRTAILGMIGGTAGAVRRLDRPDVLTLAALRLAGLAPPPPVPPDSGGAALTLVARNGAADPATRVTAAEGAAARLRIDARELTDLYRSVPAKGDELLRIADIAARDRGARTRALVFQAVSGTVDGGRRASLAALAVGLVPPALRSGPVGAVAVTVLDTVAPAADTGVLAVEAAALYFAQGKAEPARRWHTQALAGHTPGAERLWPLAAIVAGPPPGGTALGFAAWLDAALRGADPARRARVAGLLALLDGLGFEIPEEAWRRAAEGEAAPAGPAPNPALWQGLKRAAATGQTGETVLIALTLLGNAGPATAPPVVTGAVAGALRAVGLPDEARALAREAAAVLVAD